MGLNAFYEREFERISLMFPRNTTYIDKEAPDKQICLWGAQKLYAVNPDKAKQQGRGVPT